MARVRVTQDTAGGLSWREFVDGMLVQTGVLELDAMGSTRSGWSEDALSGKRSKTRRVMAAYRGGFTSLPFCDGNELVR